MTADTLPLGWDNLFDMWYDIHHYSVNGAGADTVGFAGISAYGEGLSPGFDEISYKITIGPIDDLYDGKTICLDSSLFGFTFWQNTVLAQKYNHLLLSSQLHSSSGSFYQLIICSGMCILA